MGIFLLQPVREVGWLAYACRWRRAGRQTGREDHQRSGHAGLVSAHLSGWQVALHHLLPDKSSGPLVHWGRREDQAAAPRKRCWRKWCRIDDGEDLLQIGRAHV